MKKRMLMMILIVGGLFGLIFFYQGFKSFMIKSSISKNISPAVTVSTMKIQQQSWQPKIKATGSLRSVRGVDVTTEIAGIIRAIQFTPGSTVNKDTSLVRLNDDAEVAQLQALNASLALAKTTFERDQAQYAIQAVSKQIVDNDLGNLKNLEGQVAQQKATIAKKNIQAPFSGKLGISYVNPGQYLNPGDKIVTLQTLDPIYVDFYVPQQNLPQIAKGQLVKLSTDTYPGKIFQGKITTVDPKVDPTTRNIQVEATISNPKQLLLPGMFGTVEVASGKPNHWLTLPKTAISFNPYGEIVFLIKEQGKDKKGKPILIASQTIVTVGDSRGDQIAVLKGLKEGDVVVTSGQLKLRNGSTVIINNSIPVGNNPAPVTIDQ